MSGPLAPGTRLGPYEIVSLGANALGDEAIVIFRGERMRWRNMDSVQHTLVPDTPSLPEFDTTGL